MRLFYKCIGYLLDKIDGLIGRLKFKIKRPPTEWQGFKLGDTVIRRRWGSDDKVRVKIIKFIYDEDKDVSSIQYSDYSIFTTNGCDITKAKTTRSNLPRWW